MVALLSMKILTVIIFIVSYIFIIKYYNKKFYVVWGSVALILLLGVLTPLQAWHAINWNVILLYFGMLFVSEVFLISKMPDYLAVLFTSKTKTTGMAMVVICAFSGFLSIFLENVAVVLLVAPIAMSIAKKEDINPVPLFIGIAICSNLQGVATLIGDPPSMLLAGFAKLNFNQFFFLDGKPSIFFAVEISAIAGLIVLYLMFKKHSQPMQRLPEEKYVSVVPSLLVVILIAALVLSSFAKDAPYYTAGLLCVIFGLIGFLWYLYYHKDHHEEGLKEFVYKLDWGTGIFLIGMFVLVESLSAQGLMADLATSILGFAGDNTLALFIIFVSVSVVLSAFVDNVPYLIAMLPVTQIITHNLDVSPYLFYFGLLLGASVGGNITPIGASANVVAMGIVKKEGHQPSFWEFVKIGLPFTVIAVIVGSTFLWFVFA